MDSLQPPGGHSSTNDTQPRTFASALLGTTATDKHIQPAARLGQQKGEIAAFFPRSSIHKYSQPFRYALIGKFSQGRPTMEVIQKFFVAQDLKDQFSVGLLDSKHVLIRLQGESDFHRIYSRMIWYISGKPMRVFKWTEQFHVDKESSLVPVWIKFPKLPIHFFNKEALFTLASLFSHPLRLDSATINFKRPSVARLQVEVDLLKPLPSRLWIGMDDSEGFWQTIELDEQLPSYCNYCWHIGHEEAVCYVKNPDLKSIGKTEKQQMKGVGEVKKLQYKPKIATSDAAGTSGLTSKDKQTIPIDLAEALNPPTQEDKDRHPLADEKEGSELPTLQQIPTNPSSPTIAPKPLEFVQLSSDMTENHIAKPHMNEDPWPSSVTAVTMIEMEEGDSVQVNQLHSSVQNTAKGPDPSSVPIPESSKLDTRQSRSEGEDAYCSELVPLDELRQFSSSLPQFHPEEEVNLQIEHKRRPRRNYFNQTRTVVTRSQIPEMEEFPNDKCSFLEH